MTKTRLTIPLILIATLLVVSACMSGGSRTAAAVPTAFAFGAPHEGFPKCPNTDQSLWNNCGAVTVLPISPGQHYQVLQTWKNGRPSDVGLVVEHTTLGDGFKKCSYQRKAGKPEGWKTCINTQTNRVISKVFYVNGEPSAEGAKKIQMSGYRSECEQIGFTPNTDKFAECVLRLMEMRSSPKQPIVNQTNNSDTAAIRALLEEEKKQRQLDAAVELMKQGRDIANPPSSRITCKNNPITRTTVCE